MRRSRRDIQLGRVLMIGQRYRLRHDGSVWAIRQVHRKDCFVELRHETINACVFVPFATLRDQFVWLVDQEAAAA